MSFAATGTFLVSNAPAIIGAAGTIGGAYLSSKGSKTGYTQNSKTKKEIIQLPDYAESEGARKNWWQTLQDWQKLPGYGAIQPDWEMMWKNASDKVQRYFMGGPEGPGAIATVKANLARRNASEDPASDTAISRLLMSQGNTLADMATNQAIQKANLSESGRTTWLNSLMQLAGLKPAFAVVGEEGTTTVQGTQPSNVGGMGNVISALGGNLLTNGTSGVGGLDQLLNWFTKLGQGKDAGIGGVDDVLVENIFNSLYPS